MSTQIEIFTGEPNTVKDQIKELLKKSKILHLAQSSSNDGKEIQVTIIFDGPDKPDAAHSYYNHIR